MATIGREFDQIEDNLLSTHYILWTWRNQWYNLIYFLFSVLT